MSEELWEQIIRFSKFSKSQGIGKYVDIDDITVYYEIYGAGDPLFLLHGGIHDLRCWFAQIPVLSKYYRVIVPDTRAHGRTTDSDKPLSYELFASDVLRLMEHLGIKNAYIGGWSDGGNTGLVLAMNHPEVVKKLVTIGTPYNISNYYNGVLERFQKFSADDEGVAVVRKLYEQVASDPKHWSVLIEKLVQDMFTRAPNYTLDQLMTIKCPTLIIMGANEQFYPVKHAEEMVKAIPNGKLTVIPDAAHSVLIGKPKEVNKAILNFLQDKR